MASKCTVLLSICHCDEPTGFYQRKPCLCHQVTYCSTCDGVSSLVRRCRTGCRPDTSPLASDGASMTCSACGMPTCISCPGPVMQVLEFCNRCLERMEGEDQDIDEPGWPNRWTLSP